MKYCKHFDLPVCGNATHGEVRGDELSHQRYRTQNVHVLILSVSSLSLLAWSLILKIFRKHRCLKIYRMRMRQGKVYRAFVYRKILDKYMVTSNCGISLSITSTCRCEYFTLFSLLWVFRYNLFMTFAVNQLLRYCHKSKTRPSASPCMPCCWCCIN